MYPSIVECSLRIFASRHHPKSTMSIFRHHFVSRILVLRPRFLSTSSVRRKDPWSMPHTPEHIASTTSPTNTPPPKPLPRPGESIETTRSRLVYQSRKRGTLENDLLLSTFAQEHLGTMNAEELSEFDKVRFTLVSSQIKTRLILLLLFFFGGV